jgi:phosphatidylserine/phosphatidylglycerophosphate/cardiolipin synthase-like enzyme
MNSYYLQTAVNLDWLLSRVESWLETCDDGQAVTAELLRRQLKDRRATENDLHTAIEALRQVGILRGRGGRCRLDLNLLKQTGGYRRGVRDGLGLRATGQEPPTLCAALPPGLPTSLEAQLRAETADLLSALLGLIASATGRIILASPFWDAPVAGEMSDLLMKRMAAGVDVDLLGRFGSGEDTGSLVLRRRLAAAPRCRLFDWYERSAANQALTQTFHFKAAAVDGGRRAWLGTANFTTSNLRSRMELGFVVSGPQALALSRVLDLVLGLAKQIQ